MKTSFRRYFLILVGFSSSFPALSQTDTVPAAATPSSFPEVIVTANRLQVPVNQVGSSMTVITAQDIQRKQAKTVLEALQGVPGIDAPRSGPLGQVSSIFLRGANSDHTLVLLDGVPLNDPLSTARLYTGLDQISVENVDRIEIVRGPQSPLYGSNALGGVIHILTKKGGKGTQGSLLFERGEYRTFRGVASFSDGDEKGYLSLSAERLDSEGFSAADKNLGNSEVDGHENNSASLRFGGSFLPDWGLDGILRFNESRTEFDDFGGAFGDDPDRLGKGRQFMARGDSQLDLLEGSWEAVLTASYFVNWRGDDDGFNDPSDPTTDGYGFRHGTFDSSVAQLGFQNNLKLLPEETLVVGLQVQQEWGRTEEESSYAIGFPVVTGVGFNPLTVQTSTTDTLSAYLESRTALERSLFFTLGGRVDEFTTYGAHFTYRGTASYLLSDLGTKFKATYGTGFKTPSLYQLYSVYGNLALLPEQSVGWDLGIEQSFLQDQLQAGATYFNNDFTNLIFFASLPGPPYGQYVNQIEARTWGAETFISISPLEGLWAKVVYTYTETKALDPNTGEFAPFLRRPWHKAGLDLTYRQGKADLGICFRYVGQRKDYNYPSTLLMPEHLVVNLTASYQVDEHLKLYGRTENLLNEIYEEIYGYGTSGLSVAVGAQISL